MQYYRCAYADRINYLDFSIDFNKNCTVLFNKTDIFPFKVIRSFMQTMLLLVLLLVT